jgi:hypothetical protein
VESSFELGPLSMVHKRPSPVVQLLWLFGCSGIGCCLVFFVEKRVLAEEPFEPIWRFLILFVDALLVLLVEFENILRVDRRSDFDSVLVDWNLVLAQRHDLFQIAFVLERLSFNYSRVL